MLQWDWPQTWSFDDREAIRVSLETAIRAAMAKGESKLVRGVVHVELPEIGPTPPQVMLSGIRELSLEHTAVMVKVRYDGEFALKLQGLQVNVDTVGSNSTSSNDPTLSMPFYCPLEMTLSDIHIDGVASIEIFQEVADVSSSGGGNADGMSESWNGATPTPRSSHTTSPPSMHRVPRSNATPHLSRTPSMTTRSSRAGGFPGSGYGVLLGAGGRRAMRPPEMLQGSPQPAAPSLASLAAPRRASLATSDATANDAAWARAAPLSSSAPPRHSLIDLATKRAVVKKRRVKVQLFGDPIKGYKVESNLVAVPGAGKKVEEHIQDMLKPIIERLMTDGINVELKT
ncbi:hypothetical protein ABB37_06808 [Leptomonas pyrrhocoris]|uniref:Uncharacterized protein n=1 Tax=Leptomonas pyrrhocoris TaxID=157538 RepID=A0A0N0VED6_LEPPY|nr:hypothetical protein ABB37_06808 [Leptomonas pyrrhocoris]KPA78078.1 hypothetical protein ABB37_06808 [Leptomonas pyrrhocoris]|eukprot:XP_015656517.1 hypothetical protein ABB37_06808 [Leptomonas pyrrhocoris]